MHWWSKNRLEIEESIEDRTNLKGKFDKTDKKHVWLLLNVDLMITVFCAFNICIHSTVMPCHPIFSWQQSRKSLSWTTKTVSLTQNHGIERLVAGVLLKLCMTAWLLPFLILSQKWPCSLSTHDVSYECVCVCVFFSF